MSATVSHTFETQQRKRHRILSARLRRGLALIGAIGIGLLLAGIVLALNNYQAFRAAGEQVDLGIGVSGSYTDTFTADGAYRVVKEEYVSGEARTSGDNPSDFSSYDTYTDFINLTPYTMSSEGGFVHQIGIHIFEAGDTQMRLALYEDTEGVPRLLLAQSEPLSATSTGWLWFDIEPQSVPGDTRYWLAYQATNDDAKLGWKWSLSQEGYRFLGWGWGPFPNLLEMTWGPVNNRTCYQIAYTATQYALDVAYTIPVTPTMDAYTLTVRGATSGEPFSVTADDQAVGIISYNPTTRYVFSDDMESSVGGWTANGFTRIVTDSSYYSSPTHVWWTDDVPYGSSASLTSIPIELPFSARDLELRFWHRMVSEFNYDGGWVEYRTQNENGTWPTWSAVTDTMFIQGGYNSEVFSVPSGAHAAWTWTITGVVRIRIPVTAAGHSIQWRWIFECDVIGAEPPDEPDGWWIDDVRVLGTVSNDTDLVFSLPLSLVNDGQVTVQFQDTITNSYPDLLGIDLIEIAGVLYNRPPTVTITTPNGGEYWSGTQTVEWSGSDLNRDIIAYNVYLSTNGGVTWTTSLYQVSYSETEMPATHSWPGFDTSAFGDSDACLIRVEASDGDASASDQSDAVFTIDNTDPSIANETPADGSTITTTMPTVSATLADATSEVDDTAITMTVDGNFVAHTYDEGSGTVSYTPISALTNASHVATLSVQDRAGNAASRTWSFSVNEPPASVLLTAAPTTIAADGVSTSTVTATVRSNSGHPVADGTEVVFSTTMGTLAGGAVYTTTTQSGVAIAVLTAPETDGTASITARAGEAEGTIEVSLITQATGEFYIYLPIVIKTRAP